MSKNCEYGIYYGPRCRKRGTVHVRYIAASGWPSSTLRCDEHKDKSHFKGHTITATDAIAKAESK